MVCYQTGWDKWCATRQAGINGVLPDRLDKWCATRQAGINGVLPDRLGVSERVDDLNGFVVANGISCCCDNCPPTSVVLAVLHSLPDN